MRQAIAEPGRRFFAVARSAMRLAAVLALLMVVGCRWPYRSDPPKPLSRKLTWCGRQAALIRDSIPSDTSDPAACIRVQRLEFPGSAAPFSMELRRYRSPVHAFIVWEEFAGQTRPQEGCVRVGLRWAFIHGPYIGLTDSSAGDLYPEEFRERLAAAEEPAMVLPAQFEAFPLLGRIPGSERVSMRDFLGGPWSGPVFSVSYPCHGDTAIAFRAIARNSDSLAAWMHSWKGRVDSGKDWRFEGEDEFGRPMILGFLSGGIVGFSGCFDSEKGREYVEKMRKMQVFWHDP